MGKSRKKAQGSPKPVPAQSSLVQSADLFRVVAETATDAIITIDERSRILFANPATERIFGHSISELLGREITLLMPEYLREIHRARVKSYLATGTRHIPWSGVALTGLHKSGKEIPVEVSFGERVRDGKHIFTGIVRDVSERTRAEKELRESREKYARMIQSSPDSVTLRSLPERRYVEVNEGFTRMTGYTAEEALGKTPAELNLWPDQEERRETLERLQREGEIHKEEFRYRTKSGQIRFGELSAVRLVLGDQPYMLSVSHDITESKRAAEELQRSESNFRSLIQDAPFGIYRVTLDGRLLQVNPALLQMLGYESEAELLRCDMAKDIYRDPDKRGRLIDEYWQKKDFRKIEAEWKCKNGRIITVLLTGRPVADKDGGPSYFEVFAEDVTERRILERQLLQSQKMEAIGRLAGGIAHDFNNLLGVILGHSEILGQWKGQDSRLRRSAEAIQNATERAAALTTQLLAFSRKQVVEPKIIDINSSIREMERLLRRVIGEDIELAIRCHPDLGNIQIDPGQFDQVLMNLTVNARDAMLNGGKLIVETANLTLDDVYVSQHLGAKTGCSVMLAVSDTGIGMDQETMSHIFEPFFTTKEKGKGTGLGLSTVYGIVKQCGGYIMAYSEPGQGTTFKIYFPRVEGPPQGSRQTDWNQAIPKGTETILVVEDESALRELTCHLLEDAGYRVLDAPKVEDAIRVAEETQCRIDLLLTDVVMPSMDGHELARRLAACCPGLKVLYMSGYTDDVIVHRGVLAQGTLLMQKPFTRSVLLKKVREALGPQV